MRSMLISQHSGKQHMTFVISTANHTVYFDGVYNVTLPWWQQCAILIGTTLSCYVYVSEFSFTILLWCVIIASHCPSSWHATIAHVYYVITHTTPPFFTYSTMFVFLLTDSLPRHISMIRCTPSSHTRMHGHPTFFKQITNHNKHTLHVHVFFFFVYSHATIRMSLWLTINTTHYKKKLSCYYSQHTYGHAYITYICYVMVYALSLCNYHVYNDYACFTIPSNVLCRRRYTRCFLLDTSVP